MIIIDDDDPGELRFAEETLRIPHSATSVDVSVKRTKGASGKVSCRVKTEMASAKPGLDYGPIGEEEEDEGELIELSGEVRF